MSAPSRQRPRPHPADLLGPARSRLQHYLYDLAELVAIDSGSYSPDGVNAVADWVQARLTSRGFAVERIRPPAAAGAPSDALRTGDVLVARKAGRLAEADGGRRILLVAHMDTVFEDGTAAERPFTLDGTHAHGPGVSDDKGGLLAGLTAIELLQEQGTSEYAELVFLATPDEEIGSPVSRPITEEVARDMHYALGLECARENGDLVVARKGVADFRLTVTGRAAHAGIEPERGANAALAAAHLVVALQALNGRWDGVTVNVGVVRAGQRPNIVCPEAELRLEVRAATAVDVRTVRWAIEDAAARPTVPGTTVTVEQLDECPPMEATAATHRMFAVAQQAAAALGFTLGATATGGVGDANLIAGTGVPVLDGLGPVGGADHSPQEWLDTATVPERIALLASLITALGDGDA
ncbi:M20 family metallopeptidase [Streptomyces wuyuanensis]|uniref:Glutamate carboxypeptidase n=1 Tax=Streptomyces wuyuanensis TaxID=1196353 RepID=A0A1H0B5U3_9ACTN|nr:M20 family metallopeptidase [Streptomyces wuyuanensis]SDN40683.1 glutamate carboxypeptidase [Streptomyces wuyuanensis]